MVGALGAVTFAFAFVPQVATLFTASRSEAEPINLDPLPERSLLYDSNGQPDRSAARGGEPLAGHARPDPVAGEAGDPGGRGRELLQPHRREPAGHAAGAVHQRAVGLGRAGRLDHHDAAREERAAQAGAHARPQGPRGRAGVPARADHDEGRDPRALPQHRLLRQRHVRRAGRGGDVLRQEHRRAHVARGRAARGDDPRPARLRPVHQRAARDRAAAHRVAAFGRDGRPHAGRSRPVRVHAAADDAVAGRRCRRRTTSSSR